MTIERGKLIVFEGVGGSGKSTQIRRAKKYLCDEKGIDVLRTREPGGVKGAEIIRKLIFDLKEAKIVNADHQMALFFASRKIWLESKVKPTLGRGGWVLTDRCDTSTNAYQGYGEGGDLATIAQFSSFIMGTCRPDAVLLIDISIETFMKRRGGNPDGDPFDKMGPDYCLRVIEGYRKMAKDRWMDMNWYLIDGEGSISEVWGEVRNVLDFLATKK
jgi:dTMP kinase